LPRSTQLIPSAQWSDEPSVTFVPGAETEDEDEAKLDDMM